MERNHNIQKKNNKEKSKVIESDDLQKVEARALSNLTEFINKMPEEVLTGSLSVKRLYSIYDPILFLLVIHNPNNMELPTAIDNPSNLNLTVETYLTLKPKLAKEVSSAIDKYIDCYQNHLSKSEMIFFYYKNGTFSCLENIWERPNKYFNQVTGKDVNKSDFYSAVINYYSISQKRSRDEFEAMISVPDQYLSPNEASEMSKRSRDDCDTSSESSSGE